MSAPRMRLGLLVHPGNPTVEAELSRMAPPDIEIHIARLETGPGAGAPGSAEGMVARTRATGHAIEG